MSIKVQIGVWWIRARLQTEPHFCCDAMLAGLLASCSDVYRCLVAPSLSSSWKSKHWMRTLTSRGVLGRHRRSHGTARPATINSGAGSLLDARLCCTRIDGIMLTSFRCKVIQIGGNNIQKTALGMHSKTAFQAREREKGRKREILLLPMVYCKAKLWDDGVADEWIDLFIIRK